MSLKKIKSKIEKRKSENEEESLKQDTQNVDEDEKVIIEEVGVLQNDGIFRREILQRFDTLLTQLQALNSSVNDLIED